MTESRHGAIALIRENCTSCYICARECPSWCISIDAHAEQVAPVAGAPARRQRAKAVLDRFSIDFSDCMFCGICVEECPFDALAWVPDLVTPAGGRAGLVLEIDDLTALAPTDGADG